MARRQHLTASILLIVALFFSISYLFSGSSSHDVDRSPAPLSQSPADSSRSEFKVDLGGMPASLLEGESIAPKLENATLKYVCLYTDIPFLVKPLDTSPLSDLCKWLFLMMMCDRAELGRATWKFMHTMVARFPEEPSPEERKTLETFVYLFSRLYPCGDCARHFRGLLAKYPPQTSSRNAAAGWLCFVHNQVNERLKKPIFDCNNIGDFYDCGCGEEGKKGDKGEKEDGKVDTELVKE